MRKNILIAALFVISTLLNVGFISKEICALWENKHEYIDNKQIISAKLMLCTELLDNIKNDQTGDIYVRLANVQKNLSDIDKALCKANQGYFKNDNMVKMSNIITDLEHDLLIIIDHSSRGKPRLLDDIENIRSKISEIEQLNSGI